MNRKHKGPQRKREGQAAVSSHGNILLLAGAVLLLAAILYAAGVQDIFRGDSTPGSSTPEKEQKYRRQQPEETWLKRAYAIGRRFYPVYGAGWEGANGAIGDAHLFAITGDSSIWHFHMVERDIRRMINGTWVDDRAWVSLAELTWWDFTGRKNRTLVEDAKQRYDQARAEGRLSDHEGYWTWYNWPPDAQVNDRIFTNSNMNHMVTVACLLYEATGERTYLDDALMVWNGNGSRPGIEKTFYKGKGRWEGKPGPAAFGKQLPWEGTEYCSVAAALFRVTRDEKYRKIAVATARRIMDPANGWVDPVDFYQIHMDGNGAFVHYLLDAYSIAPEELQDLLLKIETMLEHVWSNHHGTARVTLHRDSDHAIRNGWNPNGGEDGYGVDELGTLHAQSQALRAFGVFAYYKNRR